MTSLGSYSVLRSFRWFMPECGVSRNTTDVSYPLVAGEPFLPLFRL